MQANGGVPVNGFINGGNAFRERKTIGIKKNLENQKLLQTRPNHRLRQRS